MNIVFVGAVEEGWMALNAILEQPEHKNDVSAIISIDDAEAGSISGYRSFDGLAEKHGIAIHKIKHIRSASSVELIKGLAPDLLIVIGWSQLVSDEVLRIPRLGSIGLHTTLLPRHRGRAPIPWAIIKGLGKSGNTLFYFTPGVDNGDIIGQEPFYITLTDTAQTVYEKATHAGVNLVLKYLPMIKDGTAPRIKQDESMADHWPKRTPADGLIDWNKPALEIHNLIRGVSHPYPGAFTYFNGRKIIVWSSGILGENEIDFQIQPGKILDITEYDLGIIIGTGNGVLLLTRMQFEDSKEISAFDFAKMCNIVPGNYFNSAKE